MSDTLITEGFLALSEAIKSGRKKKRGRKKSFNLSSRQQRIARNVARDVSLYGTGVVVGGATGAAAFPRAPQKFYTKLRNMRYSG